MEGWSAGSTMQSWRPYSRLKGTVGGWGGGCFDGERVLGDTVSNYGRLGGGGRTMGNERHCDRLRDLQLAGDLGEGPVVECLLSKEDLGLI